jgi:arginase
MATVAVPYHTDQPLAGFDAGLPADHEVVVDLPAGDPWHRMGVLYEEVARVVSRLTPPVLVVSGDCTTSLGVLAGLQRAGHDAGIVWFDAHADFHTEATSTSGYLGGMPLALAAGIGTLTLPGILGLNPVPESRVVLVDARDTDPGEHVLLDQSSVTRTTVPGLQGVGLPEGALYLHVDVDVCDPDDAPDLLYPAPGGPALAAALAAVRDVVRTGRVVAVGLAATWRHDSPAAPTQRAVMRRLKEAVAG